MTFEVKVVMCVIDINVTIQRWSCYV